MEDVDFQIEGADSELGKNADWEAISNDKAMIEGILVRIEKYGNTVIRVGPGKLQRIMQLLKEHGREDILSMIIEGDPNGLSFVRLCIKPPKEVDELREALLTKLLEIMWISL